LSGDRRPTICLFAADISGDQNAGRLARPLRELVPNVRLLGAGGASMRAAGIDVRVETTDYSFVGVLSSLRFLGPLLDRYRQVKRLVREVRPDLVVLIDSESVAVPLARWLRRNGIPTIFYFPPQVWFWGRWRLPRIVPLARRVLSTFATEADIWASAGADARWVGHPLRDAVRTGDDGAAALHALGLDPERPLVAIMPGSRHSEIRKLSAAFFGAARELQRRDPRLQFAVPLASESLRAELEAELRRSGVRDAAIYRPQSYSVLGRARVVIQSSGTATLETALLGIPSVIAYRCIPLEYYVARYLLIRVRYIGMVNILLDAMVQPEFFNRNIDAEHLAEEAWSLLTDERRREWIRSRLARLPELLGPPGVMRRTAEAVVDMLPQRLSEPEPVRLTSAGG